jgi:pSer/pThr/pTyr-binding forkhead associated (FHA) protein
MLRSTGGAQGIGMVRIEEGKEPGRVYEIRKESLSIGRSRESDIFLEDLAVSRLHASIISLGNNSYALRDEGSANGTKVNGQPVNKYQPYPLQEGDKIQLGQTVLVFSRR